MNHKNYDNYSPINKIPPLFDLQVQVFFTSFISPCPYTKNCIVSKNECANIDKETVYCSLDCLSYSAFSVKYHSQSTGIISKSLLITAMTLAIGLSTVLWTVGKVMVVPNFSVGGLKEDQTL